MAPASMTRLSFCILNLGTLLGLGFGTAPALAVEFNDPAGCQTSLIAEDLTTSQREIFELQNSNQAERAKALRTRLENRLMLQKVLDPIKQAGAHEVFEISPNSFVIYREHEEGLKELAAYELNKALGFPLNIPVTVPYRNGSLQVWFGSIPEEVYVGVEARNQIQDRIAATADLFLFDFLVLNSDRHALNVLVDRSKPLVIFDFDDGFRIGSTATLEFFEKAQSWYDFPPTLPGDFKGLKRAMAERLRNAKFDWKSALNKIDHDAVISMIARRLNNQIAQIMTAQLCIMKALVNEKPLETCQEQGFKFQPLKWRD